MRSFPDFKLHGPFYPLSSRFRLFSYHASSGLKITCKPRQVKWGLVIKVELLSPHFMQHYQCCNLYLTLIPQRVRELLVLFYFR